MVVLDTCALLELTKTNPSFSIKVYQLIKKRCLIPTMVFGEIRGKVKTGKLKLNVSTRLLLDYCRRIPSIKIIESTAEDWLDAVDLDWPENGDIADRLLVAFAQRRELSIVTSDPKIRAFYPHCLWG